MVGGKDNEKKSSLFLRQSHDSLALITLAGTMRSI